MHADSASINLAAQIKPVALKLLGEPNRQLSNGHELRYGNHGSLSVDLEKATWFDHENKQGGGVLDLVRRELRCDQRGAVDWLKKNAGLEDEPPAKAGKRAKGRIVATYDYTDVEDKPVHRTLRWEPKGFSQQRYENGKYVGGKGALDGVQRVLFNLRDVLDAKEVIVTEGEKDALRLKSLGFTATTCAEGAGKWQDSYTDVLAGKHVTILSDNDPAGRKHAQTIAAGLHGKAASVKVLDLPGLIEKGDVSDWLDAGHTADELQELIAKAPEWVPQDQPEAEPKRPEIYLSPEHWNRMLAECAGIMRNILYLRGTVPVMLARAVETSGKEIEDKDGVAVDLHGVRYRPGSLLFMEAVPGRVAWHLDEHATFWRYVRREKAWVPQHCPKEVASSLIDAAIYLGFKPCAGIVHVPLLADGRLVTESGYHAPTGLILDLQSALPDIPSAPDRKAAEKALERLLRPFRGYLSAGAAKRTAIAAAALTAVLRPSLPAAPAILIDGNNPAVGKGKLARTLSTLNTGDMPAIVTEGHSDEEGEKRIATAVLQGASAMLFDNLQRHLASSTLESMLTEPVADIRTFGKLASLRVLCRALVLLTANNASLRKDMLRRSLPVRIVVADEKPELRHFDFDPVEEARRDRSELVAAAFTVVLAWLRVRDHDENKRHRKALGSFEEWADLVAGAVSWLTSENPIDLIEEQKDQSPQAADERRVIEALVEWQEGLRDEKGRPRHWWYAKEAAAGIDAEIWAGVIECKGERPTSKQVGKWLTRKKDAVFGDCILTGRLDRKEIMEWSCRVCRVSPGLPNTPREKWQEHQSAKSHRADATNPAKPGKPGTVVEPAWTDL